MGVHSAGLGQQAARDPEGRGPSLSRVVDLLDVTLLGGDTGGSLQDQPMTQQLDAAGVKMGVQLRVQAVHLGQPPRNGERRRTVAGAPGARRGCGGR